MARTAIHPGEHLADAIEGLGITAAELAREINVSANRVTGILHGQRGITADTALRLGRYFGTSAAFWLNLQQLYDVRLAQQEIGSQLTRIRPRLGISATELPAMEVQWRSSNSYGGGTDREPPVRS